jgi:hypothetical protein
LANHRRLFEVLHAEISRSKRTEREFSLFLLDLDGLKEINDRFGHLTGDRALCRQAQTCSTTLKREVSMSIPPLYLMKPSFLNLFMNKFTRVRVVAPPFWPSTALPVYPCYSK